MVKAVEFAKKYKGRLTVIKSSGERVVLVLNQLDEIRLEPDDNGILRFKKMVARRAIRKGLRLFAEEFAGEPNAVTLELSLFSGDDEPAGVVVVDPASVESVASGSAVIGEIKQDMVDSCHNDLVWEEITFMPKGVKMRNE